MNPAALALLVPIVGAAHGLQSPAAPAQQPADPTAIDAELLRALSQPDAGRATAVVAPAPPIPTVAIRGIVVPRGGTAVAVLDVDGARARVHVGSRLAFGAGDHLRVDHIRAGEVVLSRASTGETHAVR